MALLFDDLHLAQFMTVCPTSWTADKWKCKGDILESLVVKKLTFYKDYYSIFTMLHKIYDTLLLEI